jgi:preflagellin peptidase FlaK
MEFSFLYVSVLLLSLLLSTYTDLKERIVSNKITYGLIVLGVLLHALESFVSSSFQPLFLSLSGAVIGFAFAFVLYKVGAWAGGDVKLFAGMGALLPTAPFQNLLPGFWLELPVFPFLVLSNSVLLSFPFVMAFVFWKTFKQKHLRDSFTRMLKSSVLNALFVAASVYGLVALLEKLFLPSFLSVVFLVALVFVPLKPRLLVGAGLFLTGFWFSGPLENFLWVLLAGFLASGFWEAMVHGRKSLKKKTRVSELEEGMIPGQTLYVKEGKVLEYKKPWLSLERFTDPPGVIVSELHAGGIEKNQIKKLEELGVKHLLVKESIPLIPILLLGCMASVFVGDLLWILTKYA